MDRARQCVDRCRSVLDKAAKHLAEQCTDDGRLSTALMESVQVQLMGLAQHLARVSAADAMVDWAVSCSKHEQKIARVWCAMVAADLYGWVGPRKNELGLDAVVPDPDGFVQDHMNSSLLSELGEQIMEVGLGELGLNATHETVRDVFARFSDAEIAPLAEHIHRHDAIVPETLLQAMAALGVFGVSIPEEYGGNHIDHMAMILATEELSRGSLGAGGSVLTRPEIAARVLLAGGSERQKQRWLPPIASGEHMVGVAVTEPDAGSDVAMLSCGAKRVDGGYRITGEKTWCTFAGRADLLLLLARTSDDAHRGLSLFLVNKPARTSEEQANSAFAYKHDGGTLTGQAISTVGYRGMHSYAVRFDDWFVPTDQRIGEEGRGFYLMMAGFAAGRIQTAARAVGVMQAAFDAARSYVKERSVFGQSLMRLPITRVKFAMMAARIQASRQLAFRVGRALDQDEGGFDAALVKLLSCREAEWVTREAMQLHGGMGYAEEYSVSRYWLDARVLSIFEGTEEVLATRVIGRNYLKRFVGPAISGDR
jgi:(2S)-methylsuccinyl-CoA dehydrogenase